VKSFSFFFLHCILFLILLSCREISAEEAIESFPVAFQGRFRSHEAYSRLWLKALYGQEKLPELANSPLEQLFFLHFNATGNWDDYPLIAITDSTAKQKVGLPLSRSHFSFNELILLPGGKDIPEIAAALNAYNSTQNKAARQNRLLAAAISSWAAEGLTAEQIFEKSEMHYPLMRRLVESSSALQALPNRYRKGLWHSLAALELQEFDIKSNRLIPIKNFTPYSDALFTALRETYKALGDSVAAKNAAQTSKYIETLAHLLHTGYRDSLAGQPYLFSRDSTLYYPSLGQLWVEGAYYRYRLVDAAALLYGVAACGMLVAVIFRSKRAGLQRTGRLVFIGALLLHTAILLARCYILQRPPVTNMFETVLYVPWVAAVAALVIPQLRNNNFVILACSIASCAFLALLHITQLDSGMENVQAVLNSHYWLIIHVMMVVGSYGLFALCGVLGHISLVQSLWGHRPSSKLTHLILLTMWLGIALLIPGTILGGVWAAQSWGRFWDWDPKESWAFITACVYLLWIHTYTFGYIGALGLASASILGLQIVGFTWYGVNYLLGTGLHSYGFGNGGELYFYLFAAIELVFLATVAAITLSRRIRQPTRHN
jgi:ABC-type transport system involved in cytochrome c biogenesis permease subunit